MRKLLITLLVLALVVGGVAFYLSATTPTVSPGVRYPLSAAHRALIAGVPAEADAFALIPAAAALEGKLRANPITRGTVEEWSEKQTLPRPWMIGGADLVMWRQEKQMRYLLRLDPLRALVVRIYLMIAGDSGGTLLINAPPGGGLGADEVARIAALAETLPPGDALVVQREASRGAFPPLARPAVTSVQLSATDVVLTSHAETEAGGAPSADLRGTFPKGALLSGLFASPPKLLDDLNRLVGAKVSPLLEEGGSVAVYNIDTRKLLPRPEGVIAVPADDTRRATLAALLHNLGPAEILGVHPRTAEKDGRLLLSFDDTLDDYMKDSFQPASFPAARWALRADPQRLVPLLEGLNDNVGLRLAAPRLFRSARDLRRWIGALREAKEIEAVDRLAGSVEELRVRIGAR
jgi:hypothetical protein